MRRPSSFLNEAGRTRRVELVFDERVAVESNRLGAASQSRKIDGHHELPSFIVEEWKEIT